METPASLAAKATAANEQASQLPVISQILKEKVQNIYADNKDILQPLNTATADYLSSPTAARDTYKDIFDPGARERLVSQYVTQQSVPMLTLSQILGQRMGTMQDIIGAGVNAFKADVSAKQGAADIAQRQFENELKVKELNQKSGSAKGLPEDFWKLINLANPSDTQEKLGNDSKVALENISSLQNMFKKNPGLQKQLTLPGVIGNVISGGQTGVAQKQLTSLVDILTRIRTGAALSKNEEEFYNNFVLNPSDTLFAGGKGTDESFKILKSIFEKGAAAGSNKYQPFIDTYASSLGLGLPGGSQWEIVQ